MKKSIILLILLSTFLQAENTQIQNQMNVQSTEKTIICKKKNTDILEIKQRGCCSWHGGVAGCSSGRVVCSDGTYSPSCTCNDPINPLG